MSDLLRPDEELLQRLPLPLAQLCRRAHNAKADLERHQAAFYLWEAALKLLGAACVVEYARLGEGDAELADCLHNLARPALGHWWEFVRRLTPRLADRGVPGFGSIRDLLTGRRDDLPRTAGLDAALRHTLDGAEPAARASVAVAELFDRLVHYRNAEIGHGAAGQRPGDFYGRMGRALLAGASELFGRLDVLAGRRLLFAAEVRQVRGVWRVELVGESPRRLEPLDLPREQADALPDGDRVYLEEADGALTALHPLMVYDAEANECALLNVRRGTTRADFLCYSSGRMLMRPDLGGEQRALLARALRLVRISPEQAEAWAARSQTDEPDDAADGSAAPRTLGEYELLSELGRGGMGVVYRARQPALGRQVALKCLLRPGDPKAEARFRREIRALGRVDHPHLMKVFASGADGDQWFYVMELVEGASLAAICDKLTAGVATAIDLPAWQAAVSTAADEQRTGEKPISSGAPTGPSTEPREAAAAAPATSAPKHGDRAYIDCVVSLVRQAAEAAEALHRHGVVHRDVKPGNILVDAAGARATLMDLGLAQLADDVEGRLTRTRQFVGTLRYASPEQVLAVAPVDRRGDVYGLGATLWELLALRPLFGATEATPTPELMQTIQREEPQRLRSCHRGVSRDLEAIVHKCLEKKPIDRYATAQELADDLGRYLAGEPVRARRVRGVERTWKWVRRRPVLATLLGVTVAAVVSLAALSAIAIGKEQEALREADKARKARDFLVSIFELSDAKGQRGTMTARQILDDAEKQIPKKFADQPELQTELLTAIETVYAKITANAPLAMLLEVRGAVQLQLSRDANRQPIPQTLLYAGDCLSLAADSHVQLVVLSDLHQERLRPGTEATVRRKGCEPAAAVAERNADVPMTFARLPKGTFYMGWDGKQKGTKTAITEDFEIAVHTVTQGQWQAVMGNNPSHFSRFGGGRNEVKDISDEELKLLPVENVSWEDAQEFIKKLNEKGRGRGWLYRLPTESEWEYACRGGATSEAECSYHFYFGKPSNDLSSDLANFNGAFPAGNAPTGKYLGRPTRVGSYLPNRLGICDMHGNVWQWCADQYNPGASGRVFRGGGWNLNGSFCQAAYRVMYAPSNWNLNLGFRLARVPVR